MTVGECNDGIDLCAPAARVRLSDGHTVEPTTEVCDGLDNDCDGSTRRRLHWCNACFLPGSASASARCSFGVCSVVARPDVGLRRTGYPTTEDQCDGLDNDCDGTRRRGRSRLGGGLQCGSGRGRMCNAVCSSARAGGSEHGLQTQRRRRPPTEICDGLDNDCDGTDDDFVTSCGSCSSGVGECAAVNGDRSAGRSRRRIDTSLRRGRGHVNDGTHVRRSGQRLRRKRRDDDFVLRPGSAVRRGECAAATVWDRSCGLAGVRRPVDSGTPIDRDSVRRPG